MIYASCMVITLEQTPLGRTQMSIGTSFLGIRTLSRHPQSRRSIHAKRVESGASVKGTWIMSLRKLANSDGAKVGQADYYTQMEPIPFTKSDAYKETSSLPLTSKRTNWASKFQELQNLSGRAEPGWLTVNEWAVRIGRGRSTTSRLLKAAAIDNQARFRLYRPRSHDALARPLPHWWINGVSEKIASKESKGKV